MIECFRHGGDCSCGAQLCRGSEQRPGFVSTHLPNYDSELPRRNRPVWLTLAPVTSLVKQLGLLEALVRASCLRQRRRGGRDGQMLLPLTQSQCAGKRQSSDVDASQDHVAALQQEAARLIDQLGGNAHLPRAVAVQGLHRQLRIRVGIIEPAPGTDLPTRLGAADWTLCHQQCPNLRQQVARHQCLRNPVVLARAQGLA